MLIDPFDVRSTTRAIEKARPLETFILNKLFPGTPEPHGAKAVDIELIATPSRLAQFVLEGQGPKLIKKGKRTFQTVTLPQTYEKKNFTVKELNTYNQLGNIYNADPSAKEAAKNKWVMREIQELKDRVARRKEQMAAEAISTGKLEVRQDDVEFDFDFKFKSDTLANGGHILPGLSGGDVWNITDEKILDWIENGKGAIQDRTGRNANILLLGYNAGRIFMKNAYFKKELDTNNNRFGVMNLTVKRSPAARYVGNILDDLDIYIYTQKYEKADGSSANMIDPNLAILTIGDNDNNRVHWGPIERLGSNNQPQIIQAEYYLEPYADPRRKYLEWALEQSSLPVPHCPDDYVIEKVL